MIRESLGVLLLCAYVGASLSRLEKEDILRVHNGLRGEVYPQAANMQRMLWDDQLAALAQEHSERCVWAANQNANAQSAASFPEGVGENLAFSFSSATSSDINPVRFVHEWFAESAFYDLASNNCSTKETCNHYTQLVWSSSHAIGCGLYNCENFDFFGVSLPNATFFSCLYGTAGNLPNEKPYIQGTPCSQCPGNLTGCSANLCTLGVESLNNGTEASLNGTQQTGNISAPPLVAMPPPAGQDVVTEAPTLEPGVIPSLLPASCATPTTSTEREECWRSAWLLWTQKYNQWASGQCQQPATAASGPGIGMI